MNSKCSDTLDMFADGQPLVADVLDPQKQQGPLVVVGNIVDALENKTTPLLSNNPLRAAMIARHGGCPPEIMESFIDDVTELATPQDILTACALMQPSDASHLQHPIIERFGSPLQPLYVDLNNVEINSVQYQQPLVLPIYDGQLELVQCAVMQNNQSIAVIPDGLAKGFTCFGNLQKDKPLIVTYELEAFFKIAQTDYAVALVLLPSLCHAKKTELKAFDFEQIQFVINQLSDAGYQNLYMPVRPEHIKTDAFQKLEKSTAVRLLNQFIRIEDCDTDFLMELNKEDAVDDVAAFILESIEQLPEQDPLPKGHLAKPFRWGEGKFHLLNDGLYYLEASSNGNEYKRYICSPIKVIAQTRDSTNNAWGRLLEWHDADGVKHAQAVPMELFQSDGVDLRKALAYQGVVIAPDAKARNLMQSYLMSYPTQQRALCVDRVGWHDDVFVLPHVQIGQNSNGDIVVYQANNSLDNRYQSKGTLEQWRNDVAQLVQTHGLLSFALCTAFAGQLLTPLNQQGGGFHFKGGSSKGKSTALYLASSVWGNPKQFYRTWRATGNALEHTAYMHNDGFLVLDEISEISNPKELGSTIYMLANGLGKGRMNKQIAAKVMHQWKVIFLSSGEKSLKDIMQEQGQKTKLGQEIRLADIDIDHSEHGVFDCIDFADDAAKQAIELNSRLVECYGVAGIAWLEHLTQNKAHAIEQAHELLTQYRETLTAQYTQGHIVRVANYFALVAVAGELATQAGITGWIAGTAFNAVQNTFNQWLNGFEQVGDYEDREILSSVKAFFEAHESSRFESITPDHDERIHNRIGYWKIENNAKLFYVLPEQFKNEVCKGYDSRKVARILLAHNLLDVDTGKTTKTVRLPSRDKSIRVYAVKEAIFSLDIENIKGNKGN